MKRAALIALAAHCLLLSASPCSNAEPFDGSRFKGRIALSHDGNFNDEDDWGAFPVAIAILDAFGVKEKIVHVDFNNIIQNNDARFEKEMTASVLGAAEKYGIPPTVLHNCRTDLDGAVNSIKNAVNASSRENPLYYLLAGPMDVPYRGILAADPVKRQYAYCMSHSSWNDGYGKRRIEGRNKRDVISLGIKWVQVKPGNLLAYSGAPGTKSTPAQWALFHWMRNSSDDRLKWVFTRLEAEERCDVSDATIAYSLMTGDEQCNPEKLAALLDKKQKPKPVAIRPTIRLEAENFDSLENYSPISVGRQASQNVSVRMSATLKGIVRTEFHEPYSAASGRYDVTVRYRDEKGGAATFALRINGTRQGESWRSSTNDDAWTTHTIKAVSLARGDMIEVEVTADGSARGELDFVQLNYLGLDDPAAMPGQIIVDPANRQWLKYNGQGHPCFLFGAGNPEEFFFLGTRQADGTRAGGMQDKILGKLAGAGANTFHLIALRDSRYNLEPGNGAPDSNPFENADISGRLDQDILNQWEGWLKRFEADGTIVLFTFYNDFDDYEDKAGWKLDANGNLHPQERYFVETLVNRFKHHKNIIWVINESCNKLSRAKQVRLKKVAALVAATDNFHHPIMQIFQVLYYDEVHPDKVSPEDYVNDPNVKVMGWGHYSSFPAKPEKGLPTAAQYYKELVGHVKEAAGRYVLFDMEVDKHPSTGAQSRLYAWTAAMAGVYGAINSHRPDKTAAPRETFEDDGRLRAFMETTDFFRMSPNSDLKYGSTLYVLANAPNSYVAYSHSATQNMGIRNLAAGTYLLRWFDTTDGDTIERMVTISPGDHAWPKPAEMGTEVALYVKRIEGVVLSESK